MAFVLPIAASFAAAGAAGVTVGAALTGAAGFATFASVAGGFMASAGMLTKNKTLTKVGSILGLAGVATSLASSLSSSAGEAASSAAGSAANDAVTEAAKTGAGDVLQSELAKSPLGDALGKVGGDAASMAGGAQLPQNTLGSFGQAAAPEAGAALQLDPASFGGTSNLMDQYRMTAGQGGIGSFQDGLAAGGQAAGVSPKLVEAGQAIKDKTALDTILDKINGVGKWVKDNKELAQVGGQMLAGGMQAYQQGQQFDTQMNLLAQRRARLNQPVVLGIQQPQLTTYRTGG